jgi:flavin-binding protein dodecin
MAKARPVTLTYHHHSLNALEMIEVLRQELAAVFDALKPEIAVVLKVGMEMERMNSALETTTELLHASLRIDTFSPESLHAAVAVLTSAQASAMAAIRAARNAQDRTEHVEIYRVIDRFAPRIGRLINPLKRAAIVAREALKEVTEISCGTAAGKPPLLATYLLYVVLPRHRREVVPGDLEEEYRDEIVPRFGRRLARVWHWKQSVGSVFLCLVIFLAQVLTQLLKISGIPKLLAYIARLFLLG